MNAGRARIIVARLELIAELWSRGELDEADLWARRVWAVIADDQADQYRVRYFVHRAACAFADDNLVDGETWLGRAWAAATEPATIDLDRFEDGPR